MHAQLHTLELARLAAASRANVDDARVWRWYSDLMEDDRVSCARIRNGWRITVDGRATVEDESFDCAVRQAARMWSVVPQTQVTLKRRRKAKSQMDAFDLPEHW